MYTIGFYVDETEEDRVRSATIGVRRAGLRAIHPSKYVFRSESARRVSLLRAAWSSPKAFETGIVRAHLFPLRPTPERSWRGVLAVSFPVPLGEKGGAAAAREFGAVLYHGPTVAHSFNRSVRLQPDDPGVASTPWITFLEPLVLRPGKYTLTAVLSNPEQGQPHATRVELEVPEVPERELFLVPPMLGRRAGINLVVLGSGAKEIEDRIVEESGFEPLLVQQVDEPVDLAVLSQICLVDRKGKRRRIDGDLAISRSLLRASGSAVGELPDVGLAPEGEDRVRCQTLVDVLPGESLEPGDYTFETALRPIKEGVAARESVRFSMATPRPSAVDDPPVVRDPAMDSD